MQVEVMQRQTDPRPPFTAVTQLIRPVVSSARDCAPSGSLWAGGAGDGALTRRWRLWVPR